MKRRRILKTVGATGIGLSLSGCSAFENSTDSPQGDDTDPQNNGDSTDEETDDTDPQNNGDSTDEEADETDRQDSDGSPEFWANYPAPKTPPEWEQEPSLDELRDDLPGGAAVELTQYPNVEPTEADYEAAYDFYVDAYDTIMDNGWDDFDQATNDGFVQVDNHHWVHPEYVFNDTNLDPSQPESLVFYDFNDEKTLTGVMYLMNNLEDRGKQVGGPLTIWHYHARPRDMCFNERISGRFDDMESRDCADGAPRLPRDPEMIHVWLVKHPKGQFATEMRLSQSEFLESEPRRMPFDEFKSHTQETYNTYRTSE